MQESRLTLGPKDGSGYMITILRAYEDGTDDYAVAYEEYDCYGVEEVDVQDPWTATGAKYSFIEVAFTNGASVYLNGVITDVQMGDCK